MRFLTKIPFKIIRYSGLPLLSRELFQTKKVTIIMYHDITAENAEKTFQYLSKRYNIIRLSQFLESYYGVWKLPSKSLIITFDDGFAGNYKILPVIKKLKIPVTIFLCAGVINSKRHFWFTMKHPNYSLDDMKQMSNHKKTAVLKEIGYTVDTEYDRAQALNRKEIEEMLPYVDFQSHSLFHSILPRCDDEEAEREIGASKHILENDYSLKINAIAYPNGECSARDIELCKKAGYKCGITVDFGFNGIDSDIFRLKRLSMNETDNIDELCVRASGVWRIFQKIMQRKIF